MAKGYTAAEKAAIFQTFPDDLKQAIGEYEPLEAKTLEQLHDMLIEIRRKFDLAPWHTFTKFMKILGSGKRNGYTFERQNLWTVEKAKQSSTYWNKSCQWVAIRLEVGRGSEVGSEQFYVCPSRRIIWSAATEHQVQNVSVPIGDDSSRVPRYVVVPLNFMFEHAAKHLATLGESHGPVDVYYNVAMAPKPEEAKVTKKATTPTQEVQHKAPEKREPDIQQRFGCLKTPFNE